ncbi:MAG: GNAT family N-acetyltransferase [Dysgonamonadaceae bacterium]|jgi:ribosomal protein S18 acetylase RimI-like enzyme|nr:GNAT family N-acetyltransferase [Dysgonamonadaceae bacterium]
MQNLLFIKPLYISAFPADERRNFGDLLALAETQTKMRLKIEKLDDELLAFIIYWEFESFVYVEHFAVNEQFRGKGHGGKIFREFLQNARKSVILEVEPPENLAAEKRIKFYERSGMILQHFPYMQPPYSHDKNPVNMLIMSSKYITKNDFEKIKNEIFEKVYNPEL